MSVHLFPFPYLRIYEKGFNTVKLSLLDEASLNEGLDRRAPLISRLSASLEVSWVWASISDHRSSECQVFYLSLLSPVMDESVHSLLRSALLK